MSQINSINKIESGQTILFSYICILSIIISYQMEKEQAKLTMKVEIRKDRVPGFPFYIVSTTYSKNQHHFIIAADYISDSATLSVYPFKNDMTKLITTSISLADILPRKIISTIHVNNMDFKQLTSSVNIINAQFIIGYRSGQLIVVQFKDKQCKTKYRFNKFPKEQSFLSRTSSIIFGSQDTYNTYFKYPIRYFSVNQGERKQYNYLVANNIVFQKELNQTRQSNFYNNYDAFDFTKYHLNYDMHKIIKEGSSLMYGCDYFIAFEDLSAKMKIIRMSEQVCNYLQFGDSTTQIIIALSSSETIIILDTVSYQIKQTIKTELPLRRINLINNKDDMLLVIMPQQNYILLYQFKKNRYCKLIGHKSFISNVSFDRNQSKIITAGMDHRMSLINYKNINSNNWVMASNQSQKTVKIQQCDIPTQKFSDIFSLGEYNNARNNLHSYGFGDIFQLNNHYCCSTYDNRIILYCFV